MDIHQPTRHARRRRLPALVAALVTSLCTLVVPATVVPGIAAAAPVSMNPDAEAQAAAVASGHPVVVDARTTEYAQTVANSDGSFTLTSSVTPQRARVNGVWTPVDATLRANPDGTWGPAAAIGGLTLSGGGGGPLATFSDGSGHEMSVAMPMALPAPSVTGDTALYASVLPGVDLSVTATIEGGIHEVLIVHDAASAANPALRSLRLSTSLVNLDLTVGPDGDLQATDSQTGAAVFSAPPPVMWDSFVSATGTPAQLDAADQADAAGESAASTQAGPGRNAAVTAVPASVRSGVVTLAPPASALRGADVTYPVYIDPGLSGSRQAWAYTQSYHPTRTAYKPTDNLRVGFDNWTTNCGNPCYENGISRTFLYYTGLSGIDGKYIVASSSHLIVNQLAASCSGSYTIRTAITSGNTSFGSTLDWDNQPAPSGVVDSVVMNGTTGNKTFTLTNIAPYMASRNYSHVYLTVYAANETDHCTWRHFGLTPTLSITYWSTPNAPASLTEKNGTATYACNTTAPGTWIPKATSNQITLNDTVSTPDANTALTSNMYLAANGGGYTDYTSSVTETSANTAIPVSKTITLTDGSSYMWYATAANSYRTSTASPSGAPTTPCAFQYDGTTPSNPAFSTTDYPANGPTTVISGGSGTITVTATDGGTNPSGVSQFKYDIDGTGISSGGVTGVATATGGSATVTIPLSDLHWGTNVLWAQAGDNAGNFSSAVSYTFYVQQSAFGAYSPGTAGDLDGDNQPDLVTVDAAGDVQLYSSPAPGAVDPNGNLTDDPHQYGGRVLIPATSNARWPVPDSASAAGALITHSGSFTGNNYDDLIVVQNGYMAVATNPGGAGAWTFATTSLPKPTCSGCSDYNDQDWSSVLQMVAVPTTPGGPPDLITVEFVNGVASVWLYTPIAGVYRFNEPTQLSTSYSDWNWHNIELIGAGTLPGTTGVTLWIRTRDSGHIDSVPNITAGISGDPLAAPHTVLATGYYPVSYPLMTTVGTADAAGDVPIWATTAAGDLEVIPTTTSTAGVTTVASPITLNSSPGWANDQIELGDSYAAYNNSGIGVDGAASGVFDTATANTYAYSETAMANGTMDNGAFSACPPTWTSACPSGVEGGSAVVVDLTGGTYVFNLPAPWAGLADNYVAAGQVLPAPMPGTSGPAHMISFLGAGATGDAVNGTSVDATITYTDGDTQTVTITFGDWTHDNDASPIGGETTVATFDHRLVSSTGATSMTVTHLFASQPITLLDNGNPLPSGVQIASIRLGTNSAVHIFSTALQ